MCACLRILLFRWHFFLCPIFSTSYYTYACIVCLSKQSINFLHFGLEYFFFFSAVIAHSFHYDYHVPQFAVYSTNRLRSTNCDDEQIVFFSSLLSVVALYIFAIVWSWKGGRTNEKSIQRTNPFNTCSCYVRSCVGSMLNGLCVFVCMTVTGDFIMRFCCIAYKPII